MGCITVSRKIQIEPKKSTPETVMIKSNTKKTIKINNQNYIKQNKKNVFEVYDILTSLGDGAFGSVHKVKHKQTKLIRAMKRIDTANIKYQDDDRIFLKEIEILRQIEHPNIIKIYEYYVDDTDYYLITEFVDGKQLLDFLIEKKSFSETQASFILKQVLSAIFYLHSINIVHRDIKPENVIVDQELSNEEEIRVKLVDFGTCNYFDENTVFKLKVGTPYYMAPEVVNKSYNEKCDVWSCGVLLYILLYGQPPFKGPNPKEIFKAILEYKYCHYKSSNVTDNAREIIDQMLIYDYKKRPSAGDLLKESWFSDKSKPKLGAKFLFEAINNLEKVRMEEKLQQATIGYIVHNLTNAKEIENLKNVFMHLDKNGDGRLSQEEITQGIRSVYGKKLSDSEIVEMASRIDHDMDGFVSWEEFIRVTMDKNMLISEENLKRAFDQFDTDGNGILSREEIKQVLKTSESEYISELLDKIDINKDGQVDFGEFKQLIGKISVK